MKPIGHEVAHTKTQYPFPDRRRTFTNCKLMEPAEDRKRDDLRGQTHRQAEHAEREIGPRVPPFVEVASFPDPEQGFEHNQQNETRSRNDS